MGVVAARRPGDRLVDRSALRPSACQIVMLGIHAVVGILVGCADRVEEVLPVVEIVLTPLVERPRRAVIAEVGVSHTTPIDEGDDREGATQREHRQRRRIESGEGTVPDGSHRDGPWMFRIDRERRAVVSDHEIEERRRRDIGCQYRPADDPQCDEPMPDERRADPAAPPTNTDVKCGKDGRLEPAPDKPERTAFGEEHAVQKHLDDQHDEQDAIQEPPLTRRAWIVGRSINSVLLAERRQMTLRFEHVPTQRVEPIHAFRRLALDRRHADVSRRTDLAHLGVELEIEDAVAVGVHHIAELVVRVGALPLDPIDDPRLHEVELRAFVRGLLVRTAGKSVALEVEVGRQPVETRLDERLRGHVVCMAGLAGPAQKRSDSVEHLIPPRPIPPSRTASL